MPAQPLALLQKAIAHRFRDMSLIKDALTHASTGGQKSYERLEFLGDRVLGLIIAEILYGKFPYESEGDLARRLAVLVQGEHLAVMARKIDLGNYVDFSQAERDSGGAENGNILADVFEALVGALYLDSGLEKCRDFIESLWADHFFETQAPPQHPKTALQEWAQAQGMALPEYEIIGQEGPDHAPVFRVRLRVPGHSEVVVDGRSRQAAEKDAARLFMERIERQSR
jgi:ribonuclease III